MLMDDSTHDAVWWQLRRVRVLEPDDARTERVRIRCQDLMATRLRCGLKKQTPRLQQRTAYSDDEQPS